MRHADSEAKIINGGIAALSPREKPFWDAVLGGGGGGYVDVITIHAISAPEDLNLAALEAFMKEHGLDNAAPTEESALLVNCGKLPAGGRKGEKFDPAQCQKQAAFHAFKTMVEKLADGQYRFNREEGPVYVLWGSGGLPAEITGSVVVTSVSGSSREADASSITLSDSPIFIEPR